MARDGFTITLILTVSLFVSDSVCDIRISKDILYETPGKTLVVSCKDYSGQPVVWKGPKGLLGPRTRPRVEDRSVGKLLVFNKTKTEDTGEYFCSTLRKHETKTFTLIIEEKSENATENVIENKHHYSSHRNNNFIHKHSNKKNKHITPLRETTTEDFRTFVIGDNEATSENPFFQPDDVGDVENETNNDDSITEPIVFTTEPVLTGKEGEDLKVSCGVSSSHQFTIFWSRQRGDIEEPKYERKVNDIIIRNLSREDNNDVFTCRVIDSVGEAPERNITIIVEHKPYLVYMSDTELYYPADEMVNLTCGVEANPAPVFRWTDNDGRRVRPINVSSHVSVIEVRMTEDTEGTYKCVAKNDHGKEERLFNLHLGYLPDPPLDIQLVGNTSNSISLNITLPDYVEDEEIMLPNFLIVQYRPKDKPDWEEQEYNISRVIFSVNNLEKATQYEFRAATRNLVGLSEFTNSTYFETSLAQSVQTNFLTLVSMIFVVMNLPVP